MANVCEECSAVNTDDATVCRSCGYPLFLASATPITPFRRAGTATTQAVSMLAVMPAGSRRLIAWLVGGLAAMVLLALAVFMFDIASSPPQRMQFGPNAPPLAPMLAMSLVEPASPQSLTAEAAVADFAASSASAIAAPPLPSRAPTPPKATAGQSSVKAPVAGTINPDGAETGAPASDRPIAVLAVPLPATSEIVASHSKICGDKSFLALGICLAEQCNTPALFDHPDCVQIREQDNKRREREELGG